VVRRSRAANPRTAERLSALCPIVFCVDGLLHET
jgi:hypothetical protein